MPAFSSVAVLVMLALAVASDNPPGGFVGDIVTDGVRGDATFDGPAPALEPLVESTRGTVYGMHRYDHGALVTLCGPVMGWWITGAFYGPRSAGLG